jgi:hypothetical protein
MCANSVVSQLKLGVHKHSPASGSIWQSLNVSTNNPVLARGLHDYVKGPAC